MFGYRRKSALLIDFENLHVKFGRRLVEGLDNWMLWLEQGKFDPAGVRRQFVSKQVFWVPSYEKYRPEFAKRDFETHMCRAIRKEKASSADFDLTIRAAELRHEVRGLKEVIVLSFDSDFVSVLGHIQLHDLYGVGMVDPETKFAQSYRNIVDLTIEKPDFAAAFDYAPVKRGWFGLKAKVKPAPQTPIAAQPRAASAAPAAAARFDLAAAADLVVRRAEEDGMVYLGREWVRRLLSHRPAFMVGGRPWAGGSYRHVIEAFAERNPKLKLEKLRNGGIVLVFRNNGGAPAA